MNYFSSLRFASSEFDVDYTLFLDEVIKNDDELLVIDMLLRETLSPQGPIN